MPFDSTKPAPGPRRRITLMRSRKGGPLSAHVSLLALGLALCSTSAWAVPLYSVTDLGTIGGSSSQGLAINATGQVAGYGFLAGDAATHAVRWTGSVATELLPTGGTASFGYGINASGQVSGYATTTGGGLHAARWTGTTPADLGALSSGTNVSYGYGINDSGQVVGYSYTGIASNYHAVRWTGTTPTDLGTFAGGNLSIGYGINAAGQVVGFASGGTFTTHATRWTGTTPEDLGTLGGFNSVGYGINLSGQVAGFSGLPGNEIRHAVLWTGTTPSDLGTLGGNAAFASGVNASGDVVGMSATVAGSTAADHAFLYTGGTMYDLSTLLMPGSGVTNLALEAASESINDDGQIAATGTIGGQTHALRLSPVPEPATGALFIAGAMAMLAARRSHRRPPNPAS